MSENSPKRTDRRKSSFSFIPPKPKNSSLDTIKINSSQRNLLVPTIASLKPLVKNNTIYEDDEKDMEVSHINNETTPKLDKKDLSSSKSSSCESSHEVSVAVSIEFSPVTHKNCKKFWAEDKPDEPRIPKSFCIEGTS